MATIDGTRAVGASFDGTGWTYFAVRAMPDRHWAVLRTTTATPELELLAGLNSYAAARSRAAALARAGFAGHAAGDERRSHIPLLVPLCAMDESAGDTGGDPARIGAVIRARRG
jgi:hypothetical protein